MPASAIACSMRHHPDFASYKHEPSFILPPNLKAGLRGDRLPLLNSASSGVAQQGLEDPSA